MIGLWLRLGFIGAGVLIGLIGAQGIFAEPWMGAAWGGFIAVAAVAIDLALRKAPPPAVGWGFLGLLAGMAGGAAIVALTQPLLLSREAAWLWRLAVLGLFGYIGLVFGARSGGQGASLLWPRPTPAAAPAPVPLVNYKILDTSVIIDGRIADLCETGFIEGTFLVPQFILLELQHIADSGDSLKRARGRRGLDILHRIQNMAEVDVKIIEEDFPHIKDVDSKIVALARKINAKVVTNDLNLNKVAGLQGVRVLNINELSNALKPVVLPGESMRVFILKEGKEAGQGVAYLDDGTMVVVDDAKKYIGKNIDVVVTSVLQTTAGRMIFTRMREESERPSEPAGKGSG